MLDLLNLTSKLQAIEALLADGLPETPEAEADLDRVLAEELSTREAIDQNAEEYCNLITELEALATARKAEADRVAKLAKTAAAQADRLRSALREALLRLDVKKLSTTRYQVTLKKAGGKQALEVDEFMVPAEYVTTETITTINKVAIQKALDEGQELEFARLLPRRDVLSIR